MLVNYSWPELSNTVSELSKFMDEANISHYKEILRTIKYASDTKEFWYQMKLEVNTNGQWEMHGYRDMNYKGDNATLEKRERIFHYT